MNELQKPKLVIKSQPKKEVRVQMNMSKSLAEQIYSLSEELNIGRRELLDIIVKFGLDHAEFIFEED
ncbi:hypothetical protein [Lactococcus hircilactis]|uniref:hypothetical protein n=1 Tax=Lactococcus hircilactis TaxID=1494462 RepID=UPI003FA1BD84